MMTRHVYLGRFAPFHKGHKLLLDELISRFGLGSVLMVIGSTNTLNKRTPYSFEDRREIIATCYPNLEILPLPDGKPNLEYFDGTTNDIWLDSIEELARARNERFIFYGGSPIDLEILAQRFEAKVIVSREVLKISATQVREMIEKNNLVELSEMVDSKAMKLVISKHKKFI